jgi:hypothetical protein
MFSSSLQVIELAGFFAKAIAAYDASRRKPKMSVMVFGGAVQGRAVNRIEDPHAVFLGKADR